MAGEQGEDGLCYDEEKDLVVHLPPRQSSGGPFKGLGAWSQGQRVRLNLMPVGVLWSSYYVSGLRVVVKSSWALMPRFGGRRNSDLLLKIKFQTDMSGVREYCCKRDSLSCFPCLVGPVNTLVTFLKCRVVILSPAKNKFRPEI